MNFENLLNITCDQKILRLILIKLHINFKINQLQHYINEHNKTISYIHNTKLKKKFNE